MTEHPTFAESTRPVLALTMGDVGGIGPEIVARVVLEESVHSICRPVVFGNARLLESEVHRLAPQIPVERIDSLAGRKAVGPASQVLVFDPHDADVSNVTPGTLDARAGAAAYSWLVAAIDAATCGQVDGIVTAPLNKQGLHLAGYDFPGHTEILASRCGVDDFAMMLYLPNGKNVPQPFGCGVAHVTLHTSLQSVFGQLAPEAIVEKIELVDGFLRRIGASAPRIGVAALNPHGGEGGLLGDEELRIIQPAVALARGRQIDVEGPIPADALFRRALRSGEFDGLVAMYHDQGHIALKLWGWDQAVNVTLGLPIIRTSPSHGTAYDIAGQGRANAEGMLAAVRLAAELGVTRRTGPRA